VPEIIRLLSATPARLAAIWIAYPTISPQAGEVCALEVNVITPTFVSVAPVVSSAVELVGPQVTSVGS